MTTKACVKASAIFLAAVFMMACGDSKEGVRAINLQTGQQQEFGSGEEVPAGWGLCPEDDCSTLPGVPCQNLGEPVCASTPGCELVELGCFVEGCPPSLDGSEPCDPGPPHCDVACMPAGTQSCEQITEQDACLSSLECAWEAIGCFVVCDPDGNCPPCEAAGFCRTVAPDVCEALDATRCQARPDCQWEPQLCPAIACAPDQPDCMVDCPSFCRSKDPVDCPDIGIPEPFCDNGPALPIFDGKGCVTGHRCVEDCPVLDLPYPECESGIATPIFDDSGCVVRFSCQADCPVMPPDGMPNCENGLPVPVVDDNGCVIGLECQECPPIPLMMPACEDGAPALPTYDEAGCLTGYECDFLICAPNAIEMPDCDTDELPAPVYADNGCVIDYRCEAVASAH